MKLLCDEMLAGLARWLRAAGHDAATAPPGTKDRLLVRGAEDDGRVLVTRDRSLLQIVTTAEVWLLPQAGIEAEARALSQRGVDWRAAPFTRCVMDNTPLETAGPADLARIPEESRALPGPHRVCPTCRRVYWPGSHVRRMLARLERWAAGAGGKPDAES